MDKLGQKFKFGFLLFPKWLVFQLNFGATVVEVRQSAFEMGNSFDDVIADQ